MSFSEALQKVIAIHSIFPFKKHLNMSNNGYGQPSPPAQGDLNHGIALRDVTIVKFTLALLMLFLRLNRATFGTGQILFIGQELYEAPFQCRAATLVRGSAIH